MPIPPDEAGFRRYLFENPADDTARLAYADWLRDNGRPTQAGYLAAIRREKFVRRVRPQVTRGWWPRFDPFTGRRPTIPEVITDFALYHLANPAWGDFHVVLEDGNVDDASVIWVLSRVDRDPDVRHLALDLIFMTPTQRRKLPHAVRHVLRGGAGYPNMYLTRPGAAEVRARCAQYATIMGAVGRLRRPDRKSNR